MKFLVCILFYISAVQGQSFSRFEVIVDHLEMSNDNKLFDIGTLRVKKYNRTTFIITGYNDILIPFSDDIKGQFDLYAYHGNEFRKLYEKKISKMCTFLRDDKMFMPKFITQISLAPAIKSCPIAPQRVHYYNANLPADFLPFQPPNGEKFRVDITYFLDGIVVTNVSAYVLLKKIIDDKTMLAIPKLG